MFRTLTIEGFRGIDKLSLDGLARINLLVGKNNCGKTSVLEALELLCADSLPDTIAAVLRRRGDLCEKKDLFGKVVVAPRFRNVFPASSADLHMTMTVSGTFQGGGSLVNSVAFDLGEASKTAVPHVPFAPPGTHLAAAFSHMFDPDSGSELPTQRQTHWLFIDDYGNLIKAESHPVREPPARYGATVVPVGGGSVRTVREWLSRVKLSDFSRHLVGAMQSLLPDVLSIDLLDTDRGTRSNRSGIVATFPGKKVLPFSMLGEGAWMLLSLLTAACATKDRVLLIDEIDTGLHHSIIATALRSLLSLAEELNVQVFATTHSEDCVRAFAQVAEERADGELALFRIERGPKGMKAVRYGKENLAYAMDYDREVR